jgi:CTP:molybdopterin cytidylyltransferase MocA
MSAHIVAMVLAAGLSSRMGEFKPLLPLGRGTVLERVVGLFRAAGVTDVRVVVGHRAGDLLPLLGDWGIRPVFNPAYREGMFSSVAAGAADLEPTVTAFLVHPVDIPLVSPRTVQSLLGAWERGDHLIAYPTHQGRRGHPPLISAGLAPALCSWRGKGGLKSLLRQYESRVLEVEVEDAFILRDMDHRQEYESLSAAWGEMENGPPEPRGT